jgi:outer membrane protein assembly factor BamB
VAAGVAVACLVTAITIIASGPDTSSRPRASAAPAASARWTYDTGAGVIRLAVAGGTVYVGSDDGTLDALGAVTGRLRWTYTTAYAAESIPAVAGGTVYLSSDQSDDVGTVYALGAATGRLHWSYTPRSWFSDVLGTGWETFVLSGPAVAGGTVYISGDGTVFALDAATGRLRWRYRTAGIVGSGPAVAGGTVYVGGVGYRTTMYGSDGGVYALDAATGRLRWRYTTGDTVTSGPAVAGGTVYVSDVVGQVYALDAATGSLRWTRTIADAVESSPAVAGGTVYVSDVVGQVYALDAATGPWDPPRRWRAAPSMSAATTARYTRWTPGHSFPATRLSDSALRGDCLPSSEHTDQHETDHCCYLADAGFALSIGQDRPSPLPGGWPTARG